MKLYKCIQCGRIIDIDKCEELDDDTVIGCGLKERCFSPCEDCPENGYPDDCDLLRSENEWTKTTVADLAGA